MFSARKQRRLSDLCEVTSSKRIFAADYLPEGVPFYRGKEITEKYNGCIEVSTELFIARSKFEEIRVKSGLPKPGDLLLTSVGTLGSTYVVRHGDEFYFKDGNITWFRNFNGLDSTYFNYWLSAPDGRAELKKCTIGSSQSAYTIVLLKGMEIDLPSLEEQRRIASILCAYDDLIENNTRRIAILEEMARRLYEEWFVRFRFPGHEGVPTVESELGLAPQGWAVKQLKEVATITMGLSPKGDTYNEDGQGMPLINGPVEFGEKFAKRVKWTTAPTKTCNDGDLVVCVRGSTTGKYVKSDGVYCLGRGVCALSSSYQCFVDQLFANQLPVLLNQTGGSTFPSWTGPQLKSHPVLVPPIDLLTRFETHVGSMSAAVLAYSRKNANLRTTRDLLLPKLISGELDVSTLPEPQAETA